MEIPCCYGYRIHLGAIVARNSAPHLFTVWSHGFVWGKTIYVREDRFLALSLSLSFSEPLAIDILLLMVDSRKCIIIFLRNLYAYIYLYFFFVRAYPWLYHFHLPFFSSHVDISLSQVRAHLVAFAYAKTKQPTHIAPWRYWPLPMSYGSNKWSTSKMRRAFWPKSITRSLWICKYITYNNIVFDRDVSNWICLVLCIIYIG